MMRIQKYITFNLIDLIGMIAAINELIGLQEKQQLTYVFTKKHTIFDLLQGNME